MDRFKFRVRDENNIFYYFEIKGLQRKFICDLIIKNIDTIEQCTGLKDDNGQLAYEGDIASQKRGGVRQKRIIGVISRKRFGEYVLRVDAHKYLSVKKKGFKIIGNIHTNPELLEN